MARHMRRLKIGLLAVLTAVTTLALFVPRPSALETKNADGLVEHVRAQIGNVYWYGTFGQSASRDLLEQKREQYPEYFTESRTTYAKQNHVDSGKRAYDCSGLISSYWMQQSSSGEPRYRSELDQSAEEFFRLCGSNSGRIRSIPEIPGTLVFMQNSKGNVHHVGVYIGNGYVVEARGFYYGVQKTALDLREWTHWGQLPASWLYYTTGGGSDGGTFQYSPGDTVRVSIHAREFWPGMSMKWWVPGGKYTVASVLYRGQPVYRNGQRCVLLKELDTWCVVNNLTR